MLNAEINLQKKKERKTCCTVRKEEKKENKSNTAERENDTDVIISFAVAVSSHIS